MCDTLNDVGLQCDFNIVRYNPFSPEQGQETSEDVLEDLVREIRYLMPDSIVKVIPRVGFDVNASCGMFVK